MNGLCIDFLLIIVLVYKFFCFSVEFFLCTKIFYNLLKFSVKCFLQYIYWLLHSSTSHNDQKSFYL